jgi:hypothetical protein
MVAGLASASASVHATATTATAIVHTGTTATVIVHMATTVIGDTDTMAIGPIADTGRAVRGVDGTKQRVTHDSFGLFSQTKRWEGKAHYANRVQITRRPTSGLGRGSYGGISRRPAAHFRR